MSALPTTPLVSVEEYLHTDYEPDCDYVDGELEDRNVGEKDHGKVQLALLLFLHGRRKEWNIFLIQEQRIQVAPTRFRVPDVCVFAGPEPEEQIFHHPPFLCVEVLSPEDRMSRMQRKIDDYLKFGVAYVWVVDPQTRRGWIYTVEGMREVQDGVLRTETPDMAVPLSALFAA
jgi:Uma2 family endonuclease